MSNDDEESGLDVLGAGMTENEAIIDSMRNGPRNLKYDSKGLLIPAGMGSCGANGMSWTHLLVLVTVIACLVAVSYGMQKYRDRKAA